jgi:DNA-binding NarL/FixJ family response regulator
MKRLVIIEDQTAIREMLVEILRTDPAYKLVGESGDGQSALALCLDVKPDLIVLDAKLPGLNGVDLLRRLSKQLKNVRVLVFSGHENPVLVREMLEAGAHGFVEKTAGLFEFKKGPWKPSPAAAPISAPPSRPAAQRRRQPAASDQRLPHRSRARGPATGGREPQHQGNRQQTGISVKTVDNHRTNLMRKLNLHDVASLTRYALEIGLIERKKPV